MPLDTYITGNQLRVAVAAGAWNAVTIPVGARDAYLSVEDQTASWRISLDNTIPLAGGAFINATGGMTWRGTLAQDLVVYVNPSALTTAIVLYALEA